MRMLLLAERISDRAWSPTAVVVPLARALAEEGSVVLAVDVASGDVEAWPAEVRVRRPGVGADERDPLGFRAWARGVRKETEHDVSVSFSPLADADVVVALTPAGEREGRVALTRRGVVSRAFEAMDRGRALGASAAGSRGEGLALPPVSLMEPGAGADVRAVLGIPPGGLMVLASSAHAEEEAFVALVRGFASLPGEAVLVLAGRWSYLGYEAASRAGVADRVRVVGGTARMRDLILACHVACAPSMHGSGRFAADALRLGKPVLAPRGSRGGVVVASAGEPRPGIVVSEEGGGWSGALGRACDAGWREGAGARAREVSERFAVERLVEFVRELACGVSGRPRPGRGRR